MLWCLDSHCQRLPLSGLDGSQRQQTTHLSCARWPVQTPSLGPPFIQPVSPALTTQGPDQTTRASPELQAHGDPQTGQCCGNHNKGSCPALAQPPVALVVWAGVPGGIALHVPLGDCG